MMKMNNYLFLAVALILHTNPLFENNEQEDIKDVLVDIIKTTYASQEEANTAATYHQAVSNKANTTNLGMSGQNDVERNKVDASKTNHIASSEGLNFSDFHFTITHNQAVVQFVLNHQMKSAFLEKKGKEWKLIMIADLPDMLF